MRFGWEGVHKMGKVVFRRQEDGLMITVDRFGDIRYWQRGVVGYDTIVSRPIKREEFEWRIYGGDYELDEVEGGIIRAEDDGPEMRSVVRIEVVSKVAGVHDIEIGEEIYVGDIHITEDGDVVARGGSYIPYPSGIVSGVAYYPEDPEDLCGLNVEGVKLMEEYKWEVRYWSLRGKGDVVGEYYAHTALGALGEMVRGRGYEGIDNIAGVMGVSVEDYIARFQISYVGR